ILPDGEQYKTLDTASRVFDVLMANRFGRDAMVVALGGGVVGDLAGFAAGCYQRGIGFVQMPTTLLADVDSSVGGKTAVNHPGGKNMIGAFHQPVAVVADTATLATLPSREFAAGMAEVVKYGAIFDAAFLGWLESHADALIARDTSLLQHAIHRSCEIKARIVAQDERDSGARALLNFGHTFAHAIESASGYGTVLHGEAVATGMVMAAQLSARQGRIGTADAQRLAALLRKFALPVSPPRFSAATWLDFMGRDKKNEGGRVTLILLDALGRAAVVKNTQDAELRRFLEG
ncbi:MAG: 3-dehydroquinate synthase, partial [Usitatibacter sp.]